MCATDTQYLVPAITLYYLSPVRSLNYITCMHVAERRFAFGNTYGDTSRSLSVCKHKDDCFGDFMRSKTMPVMQSAKF